MSLPVTVTTSDAYHHILPVFFKQYNKFWGDPFDLVGYKKPPDLPSNCTFVSLGVQRGPKFFTDDLAPYFQKQDTWVVWLFEDSLIKGFDRVAFDKIVDTFSINPDIGKINLTNEGMHRDHELAGDYFYVVTNTLYRLSTQPAIWNRDFLLRYMTPGLSPWGFETKVAYPSDNYKIVGPTTNILNHNEGVRKHDIHNLNMEGIE